MVSHTTSPLGPGELKYTGETLMRTSRSQAKVINSYTHARNCKTLRKRESAIEKRNTRTTNLWQHNEKMGSVSEHVPTERRPTTNAGGTATRTQRSQVSPLFAESTSGTLAGNTHQTRGFSVRKRTAWTSAGGWGRRLGLLTQSKQHKCTNHRRRGLVHSGTARKLFYMWGSPPADNLETDCDKLL